MFLNHIEMQTETNSESWFKTQIQIFLRRSFGDGLVLVSDPRIKSSQEHFLTLQLEH